MVGYQKLSRRNALKGIAATSVSGSVFSTSSAATPNGWPDFGELVDAIIDIAVSRVGDIDIMDSPHISNVQDAPLSQRRSWVRRILDKLFGGINSANNVPLDICVDLPDSWDSINRFCSKVLQQFAPKETDCGKLAAVKLETLTKNRPVTLPWWGETEITWKLNGWLGMDTDACIYAGVDEFPYAQQCNPIYCPGDEINPTTATTQMIAESLVDFGQGVLEGYDSKPDNTLIALIAIVVIAVLLLSASIPTAAAGAIILLPAAGYYALQAGRNAGRRI